MFRSIGWRDQALRKIKLAPHKANRIEECCDPKAEKFKSGEGQLVSQELQVHEKPK